MTLVYQIDLGIKHLLWVGKIDELGYVVMPDTAAELLFQVIAGRAERAAVMVTTNLPLSEWTTKFPMRGCARRCWTG